MSFLHVAESGAVTAASRRMGLTRSAVSHSLRGLESQLGLSLFHRIGKRMVLTTEGRLLRETCSDVRERLERGIHELLALGEEVRGTVRVGVFLGFSRVRLAGIIDAFVSEHAGADVRIAYGAQAWLTEQLLDGKLDLTLALRPAAEHAARIRSRELTGSPLLLVVRPQRAMPRSFEQIASLPFVDYYRSEPLIDLWASHHFGSERIPHSRIRAWAASSDLALELVLRRVGAAVLPRDLIDPYLRTKQLRIIAASNKPLIDSYWLHELAGSRPTRAVLYFRELVAR